MNAPAYHCLPHPVRSRPVLAAMQWAASLSRPQLMPVQRGVQMIPLPRPRRYRPHHCAWASWSGAPERYGPAAEPLPLAGAARDYPAVPAWPHVLQRKKAPYDEAPAAYAARRPELKTYLPVWVVAGIPLVPAAHAGHKVADYVEQPAVDLEQPSWRQAHFAPVRSEAGQIFAGSCWQVHQVRA